MSPTSHCYFDYYQSEDRDREPPAIGGFLPLEKVYALEPVPEDFTEAEAGRVGAVTIATNMAGRGTDIKLAPEILTLPGKWAADGSLDPEMYEGQSTGLQIIGTERQRFADGLHDLTGITPGMDPLNTSSTITTSSPSC